MKVNIEKEVEKRFEAGKSKLDEFAAVAQIKGLLAYDDTIDKVILRKMAPECTEVFAEQQFGKHLEMENLERKFGKKSVSKDEIQALATKYRLRFLPSARFKSAFSPEVLSDLKAFAKKHEIDLTNEGILTSKFFILGPSEVFKLDKGVERAPLVKPIERISFQVDPALFYKTDDDRFVHIRTWGGDFSILRAIKGFIWNNHTNFFFTMFLLFAAVLAIGLSFTPIALSSLYFSLTVSVVSAIAALFTMFSFDGFFSNQVWDSARKNEERKFQFS